MCWNINFIFSSVYMPIHILTSSVKDSFIFTTLTKVLLLCLFLVIAILTRVRWYFISKRIDIKCTHHIKDMLTQGGQTPVNKLVVTILQCVIQEILLCMINACNFVNLEINQLSKKSSIHVLH